MALFSEMMELFCVMNAKSTNGAFGNTVTYTDGASFNAYANKKSDTASIIAAAEVKVGNILLTYGGVQLKKGDVIKRKSDGATFKVDSLLDGTPKVASFQFKQANACEFNL